MNPAKLQAGIYRIRIRGTKQQPGDLEFNLSVRECFGLRFVAGYTGDKPPRKGKHLSMTNSVRNWIETMEII